MEQRWDVSTKRTVALIILLVLALIVYRFRMVLSPLILAFLLAFILDPIVDFFEEKARMSRTLATVLVFAMLILVVLSAPAIATPTLVRAISSLNLDFRRIAVTLDRLSAQPVIVLGQELDVGTLYQQLRETLQRFLSSVATGTVNVVFGIASTAFWFVFILLSAFYMVRDGDRIVDLLESMAPPSFRQDLVMLRRRITEVWGAFLRGQLLMAVLLAVITTVATAIIGLPNALALGLLAGAMEFVPNIGPIIAAIPAVLLAFFQGSYWIPLRPLPFSLLVLGVYILIQQIEGNVLLPRVMGRSLNLHPLIILIAIIAGGSIAGILGVLIAAPSVATMRVLGEYIYCRLTDQDPFPELPSPPEKRWLGRRLVDRIRQRLLASQWVLRPAQPRDKEDVQRICAQVWDGHDYVPEVWEEWLADSEGELTVVERKGQVVGLAKLTRLIEDEWWLEGLRVDPAWRRLGLARLLLNHHLALARRVGRGILRFGTASHVLAVHKNAAKEGFRHVATLVPYRADPLPGPCPLHCLGADDLEAAWELISTSPIFQAAGGLYDRGWQWVRLTRERLAGHIADGNVWGLKTENRLGALAILFSSTHGDEKRLSVGYITGETTAVAALFWGLRTLVGREEADYLTVKAPLYPPLIEALEAAGAVRSWEHDLWLFEFDLEGPEADGPVIQAKG